MRVRLTVIATPVIPAAVSGARLGSRPETVAIADWPKDRFNAVYRSSPFVARPAIAGNEESGSTDRRCHREARSAAAPVHSCEVGMLGPSFAYVHRDALGLRAGGALRGDDASERSAQRQLDFVAKSS